MLARVIKRKRKWSIIFLRQAASCTDVKCPSSMIVPTLHLCTLPLEKLERTLSETLCESTEHGYETSKPKHETKRFVCFASFRQWPWAGASAVTETSLRTASAVTETSLRTSHYGIKKRYVGHSLVSDNTTRLILEQRSTTHAPRCTLFLILTTPL